MAEVWPATLKPFEFGFFPMSSARSGGASQDGGEQFIINPGPRWGASGSWRIRNDAHLLEWRALRVRLHGPAIPVLLPNFDGRRLSWPLDPYGRKLTPRLSRELSGHPEWLAGTDYAGEEIPPDSEIIATITDEAGIRDTSVRITITQGNGLLRGQQFGIGENIYEIGTADLVGDEWVVTIFPPLREAVSSGTPALFTRPVQAMRCMNLDEQLGATERLRHATLNLLFHEFF